MTGSLEEMKELAHEMGRYYYKGFGNCLAGIGGNIGCYEDGEKGKEAIEKSQRLFLKIDGAYKEIPFKELHRREEFYPLFITKELIHQIGDNIKKIEENPLGSLMSKVGLSRLAMHVTAGMCVGHIYRVKLNEIIKEIRKYSKNKDFHIEVVDILKDNKKFRYNVF